MNKFWIPFYVILSVLVACNGNKSDKKDSLEHIHLTFKPDFDSIRMNYFIEAIYDSTKEGTTYNLALTHKIKKADEGIFIETYYNNISMSGTILGNKVELIAGDTSIKSIPEAELVAAPIFAFYRSTVTSKYNKLFEKISEKIEAINPISGQKETESKTQFVLSYPKNNVEEGTEWSAALHTKVGGKQIENARMKILGIKDGVAEISIASEINSNGEKFGKEFTIKGNLTGNVYVDTQTGWQNKANLVMHFIVTMDGKKTPMTQKITFETVKN